jgi:hypothetical protein
MGRVLFVAVLVSFLAAVAGAGGETMYDPVFREGKPGDVLVKGEPALLRGDLDAFVDLTQAAFDVSIPADREQKLRDALEIGFGAAAADKRQAFLDVVRPVTSLREKARLGDKDGVREGLEAFRRAIDQRLQDLPKSVASRLLGDLLSRRYEVVWKGDPEINGCAADAYLEMAAFVASLGVNENVAATPGQVDALRRDLDGALRAKPKEVRERVLKAQRLWLVTKSRWTEADVAKRFPLRWEAVRLAARALPPGETYEVQPGPTLRDYARESGNVAMKVSGYDTFANIARNPQALFEALEKGLDLPQDPPDDLLTLR